LEISSHILEHVEESAGVTVTNLGKGGLFGPERVGEVGAGEVDPAGFQLDADRTAVECGGFDQGGADAAHGVDDQPSGWAVLGGQSAGQLGQHLAPGVCWRLVGSGWCAGTGR
jgi:hypothetical protein